MLERGMIGMRRWAFLAKRRPGSGSDGMRVHLCCQDQAMGYAHSGDFSSPSRPSAKAHLTERAKTVWDDTTGKGTKNTSISQ